GRPELRLPQRWTIPVPPAPKERPSSRVARQPSPYQVRGCYPQLQRSDYPNGTLSIPYVYPSAPLRYLLELTRLQLSLESQLLHALMVPELSSPLERPLPVSR